MEKLEKVIKDLLEARAYFKTSFDAMDGTLACEAMYRWAQSIADAVALLKAQEPILVTPYTEVEYGFKPKVKVGECPICGRILNEQANNFCSRCGQAVKWHD